MRKPFTLGIFETGINYDPSISMYGAFAPMFCNMLGRFAPHVRYKHYDSIEGEYPHDLDECDAYLITGSQSDSFSDEEWIVELRQYIPKIVASGKPLTGFCFGHQIIALALGGVCQRHPGGWGVGFYESDIPVNDKPHWLKDAPNTFKVLVSHQDQVSELPPGTTLLGTNKFCPNAAYYIEDKVLCFQGHPEFSAPFIRGLITLRKDRMPKETFERAMASTNDPVDTDMITKWVLRFMGVQFDDD